MKYTKAKRLLNTLLIASVITGAGSFIRANDSFAQSHWVDFPEQREYKRKVTAKAIKEKECAEDFQRCEDDPNGNSVDCEAAYDACLKPPFVDPREHGLRPQQPFFNPIRP